MNRSVRFVLLLALLSVAPLSSAADMKPASAAAWSSFVDRYQEGYFRFDPPFAVYQGRHEFDGQLPDWTVDGLRQHVLWLKQQRTEALAFRGLNARQRFERDYLVSRVDTDLFWLEDAQSPYRNPAFYLDRGFDPSVYLARPYAPPATRLRAFVAYLKAVPGAANNIHANLVTPLPATYVARGIASFDGYAKFFRGDAIQAFAEVKDADLQAQLRAAAEPAAVSMQGLAEWLRTEQPHATDRYALGRELFAAMLAKTERVTTPLADVEAAGRADLARNQAALKEACAQVLPGGSIVDCIARIAADKPQGGVVDGARAQLAGLRQFILDKQLVTIPSEQLAQVDEAPAYQRWNFAYINIAGPYDKGLPSTYYISPPDPSWPQKDQDAYIPGRDMLLFTSAHEVWPGHFLQFLHSNRSSFRFGQLFVGYAFAEGWAHYGEEMMWEAGLGEGSPAVHVGQLSNALLRDVRFLCAIGLHTKGMSVDECATMFREQGYQDAGTARQQAARGTFDPAYLNYTLGKLMIRKLRADWTARHGGRGSWHAFHDQFLSYGGPPVPLVREQMLGGKDGELFEHAGARTTR